MLRNEITGLDCQQEQTMDTSTQRISPLRLRTPDDLRMRKFGEKTQLDYVRADFTQHLGRSPAWPSRPLRCAMEYPLSIPYAHFLVPGAGAFILGPLAPEPPDPVPVFPAGPIVTVDSTQLRSGMRVPVR